MSAICLHALEQLCCGSRWGTLAVTANPHCSLATHGYRDRPGVGDLSFEY